MSFKPSEVGHESSASSEPSEQKGEWAGDKIPLETLENTRNKLGITVEQMDEAVSKARNYAMKRSSEVDRLDPEEYIISFKTQLHGTIYVCFLSCLVYFLNREYDNIMTIWFIQTFPREAETLGITGWMIRKKILHRNCTTPNIPPICGYR